MLLDVLDGPGGNQIALVLFQTKPQATGILPRVREREEDRKMQVLAACFEAHPS